MIEHKIITGHIYEPWTNDIVTIENIRTGELLSIEIKQDEEPDEKEYLVNIANFKAGWTYSDTFNVTYGNTTIQIQMTKGDVGVQIDFNTPTDYIPTAVLAGTVLILSATKLYYRIRRKSLMSEEPETKTDPVNTAESKNEQPQEFIPYFDRIFGGTKRGWIMITSGFLFVAIGMGILAPDELLKIFQVVIAMWFGIGGITAVQTKGEK